MALSNTARSVLVLYAISLISIVIFVLQFDGEEVGDIEGVLSFLILVGFLIPLIVAQLIVVAVSVQRAGENDEWVWFWLIIAQGGAIFYFWGVELGIIGDGEKW